jgi:hypothetical protein
MQSFRNLKVWERAHALTLDIYKSSASFSERRNLWAHKSNGEVIGLDRREYRTKDVAERVTASLGGSGKLPWDRQANRSTLCSSRAI